MIKFLLRVNGQFRTENFMWYAEDTAPRPREITDRSEAVKMIEMVDKASFALRVITINTNTYDLAASEIEPGGKFEVSVDPVSPKLIASVQGEFRLTIKDKEQEKDLRELFSANQLSFHVMEVRITREGIMTFFGREGGTVEGGRWDDKTTWPAIEIVESSLVKRK